MQAAAEVARELAAWVRGYFDQALRPFLLYSHEVAQADEALLATPPGASGRKGGKGGGKGGKGGKGDGAAADASKDGDAGASKGQSKGQQPQSGSGGRRAPSDLYGAEHLVRLFVKLPELVPVAYMTPPVGPFAGLWLCCAVLVWLGLAWLGRQCEERFAWLCCAVLCYAVLGVPVAYMTPSVWAWGHVAWLCGLGWCSVVCGQGGAGQVSALPSLHGVQRHAQQAALSSRAPLPPRTPCPGPCRTWSAWSSSCTTSWVV